MSIAGFTFNWGRGLQMQAVALMINLLVSPIKNMLTGKMEAGKNMTVFVSSCSAVLELRSSLKNLPRVISL